MRGLSLTKTVDTVAVVTQLATYLLYTGQENTPTDAMLKALRILRLPADVHTTTYQRIADWRDGIQAALKPKE